MWLTEPGAEHAVFRDTVENTVRAQDGGVNGAGENESSNDHDKSMKDEAGNVRALKVHGQAANQILQVILAFAIGNDHDGEKGNE